MCVAKCLNGQAMLANIAHVAKCQHSTLGYMNGTVMVIDRSPWTCGAECVVTNGLPRTGSRVLIGLYAWSHVLIGLFV